MAEDRERLAFPERCEIGPEEVHVWRLGLDRPEAQVPSVLDPEERRRAGRFVFERHRRRYVAAHALVRHALGAYLALPARDVRIAHAPRGKPYLAHDGVDLRFNLSHSEDAALLAVASAREVGIDLEENRPGRDWLGIAQRFFAPAEAAVLAELAPSEREAAFYRCWTRKEAYLKACGAGMSMRLDSFEVSLAPGEPPALLRSARGEDEERRWLLLEVPAGAGFSAALAVESRGPGPAVRLFDLTGRPAPCS